MLNPGKILVIKSSFLSLQFIKYSGHYITLQCITRQSRNPPLSLLIMLMKKKVHYVTMNAREKL